jgi:membrane associated rhomboid family serine protease
MPGIAPETRPWATGAIVVVSLLATLVLAARPELETHVTLVGPGHGDEWWRVATAPFVHLAPAHYGYAFVALLAVAIFGMHLERRFGAAAVVLIFLAAGAAGAAGALAATSLGLTDYPVWGANGAGLGLLCAWLVEDRRAYRRGDDRDNDLLGVYVFAVVLLGLSLADPAASIVAAVGGALTGAVSGLLLSMRT